MRQSLRALHMTVRRGFLAAFGAQIRPGDFSGGEGLFWSLAALQVLLYGILSIPHNMNETLSFYITYSSLFACLLMVTGLPFISFLSRCVFGSQQPLYILPIIFLSIHIPVLLAEELVWIWGRYFWDNFTSHLSFWNEAVSFILFILVFRTFLMNERSTLLREQFRMMLVAMAFIATLMVIPGKGYFQPFYLTSHYVRDDFNEMTDEELFSRQTELLQNLYKNIKPSQPGKVDVFTVTYGGYGYQQVFRREALFAQQQLDRSLGSSGRSITLANSEASKRSIPLADLTNLYGITGEMARKAQTNEDVLVLYITSHGGQDSEISTNISDTELMRVDAHKIAQALKASGFRWKVVIVSACYSGSFIPILHDDDTLIITAASAVRTSFGCSDDADLTYFGEAFLKDALPKAKGFEDAFKKAKAIIEKRETAEKIDASYPQIDMGQNIRSKLAGVPFNAD